ncbi:MAG: NAD(P)H-hydrate dehydratase [Flavobacteriales bacterium]|nr:NAD(P)H-hydrate dehydratase [Flavobacteriales bacterium]
MVPVLSAEQVRQADAHTIAHEPIASIDLMERASTACFERLQALYPSGRVLVVAGPGNNGGDGLVVARLLHQAGREVQVALLASGPPSPDNRTNQERLRNAGAALTVVADAKDLPPFGPGTVIVDALFGTGLSRPLTGVAKALVQAMNSSGLPIVSIDLPSGLFAEDNGANDTEAIARAAVTLTFEVPKLALLLRDNAPFTGRVEVLPIGLDADFIRGLACRIGVLQPQDLQPLLRPRMAVGHKGDFGHALLIAGSKGMLGAAVLAASAAVRSGAGLVTTHVPNDETDLLHAAVPESLVSLDADPDRTTALPKLDKFSAVGIGPGLGTDPRTAPVLKLLIQEVRVPLVLDADALNILAEHRTWLAYLPQDTILTPHPKEFDRLFGASSSSYERLMKARDMSVKHGLCIVLKGAPSATCDRSGQVVFNDTGNAGMAKGGSGDVLTGLITGLRAQGYSAQASCWIGNHLHGLAGDLVAERLGMDGMTPMDLSKELPYAWQRVRSNG